MRKFYLIGFLFLLAFDTMAQISFKLTAGAAAPLAANSAWILRVIMTPWVYFAILGYIGAFVTWMSLLRRAPVGPAFAASHLEVVTVMIASYFVFHEQPDLARLIGAGLITVGIIVLAFAEEGEENGKSLAVHREKKIHRAAL